MFNDDALSVSVRPLLGSIILGFLLGACGGSGSDSTELEPSLGQGNAVAIRAEYEAALKGQTRPGVMPAVDARDLQALARAGTTGEQAPLVLRTVPVQVAEQGAGADPVGVSTKAEAIAHAQHYHELARQVVEKANELRARPQRCGDTVYPAVGPVKWNARVAYAALLESEWMVARNQFSHAWEDGKYVWHRFDMAQYAWKKADENIAAGFRSLDDAMQAWLDSPSHCKAMMRADIREIGLSVLPGQSGNRYRSYWTMALGSR